MRRTIFRFLAAISIGYAEPLCPPNPPPHSPCAGWESLSQLGSLIPERIWGQEFDLLIDRKAFRKKMRSWIQQRKMEQAPMKPLVVFGESHRYLLHITISGDPCRLLDRYAEFEWSPFWNTPRKLQLLKALEKKIQKEQGNDA